MSATYTYYKRPHVDIFIYIEMGRERNQGIKKTPSITKDKRRPTDELDVAKHLLLDNVVLFTLLLREPDIFLVKCLREIINLCIIPISLLQKSYNRNLYGGNAN